MTQKINSYLLFESSYLELELMPHQNYAFALREFKHMIQLEEEESAWESRPKWLEHYNKRPIGNKATKTKANAIDQTQFTALIESYGFNRFDKIVIRKNRLGDFHKELQDCLGFGTSNFGIFFNTESNFVNHLWLDLEDITSIDNTRLIDLLCAIGSIHKLILVDWNEKRVIDLSNLSEIEGFLR